MINCLYDTKEDCVENRCKFWKQCRQRIEHEKLIVLNNMMHTTINALTEKVLKLEKEVKKNGRTNSTRASKTKNITQNKQSTR